MDKIHIEIIQPTGKKCDMKIDSVILPGIDGDFEVLRGHTPFITKLRPGTIELRDGKNETSFAIHNGFVTIENNSIIVITETIESKDEIDIKRAEEAKTRAEMRISGKHGEVDYRRAEIALQKAIARINTVS